jgi:recombination protein RecR
MYYPEPIERLIDQLTRLPGIGRKTAARLTFFLLHSSNQYIADLSRSIVDLKEKIRLCSVCFNITDVEPCQYCRDERRAGGPLCVVEEPSHIMAIESSNPSTYRYHVLHGVINPIEGIGPEDIRIPELKNRIEKDGITELIIATNPTIEGNTTAHYIAELTKPLHVRITRIASGIPVGGDIVYTDPLTLKSAIENRRSISDEP